MISLKNLPWRNLKVYPGRTAALMLFAALMAFAVFGGTMMIGGVRSGLETVKSRLGADIMVTPESAKNEFDAQTVLLKAEPGYFYMDASVLEEIRAIAAAHNALIVEDAAESLGAKYKLNGQWVETGTLGNYNCISFNGNNISMTVREAA